MFIFLDTETTGTGPEDRLCQITFKPEVGPAVSGLFKAVTPIIDRCDVRPSHHQQDG
jgi:hypothetical protein